MKARERAARDRTEGRLWKARDRLAGALANAGNDLALLDDLAQVHWDMGDQPAAGTIWYLTDRDDEISRRAAEAFIARWGGRAASMLHALPLKFDVDAYPPAAQKRLSQLIQDAATEGYRYRSPSERAKAPLTFAGVSRNRFVDGLGVGVVILATIGVWLIGVLSILYWLLR